MERIRELRSSKKVSEVCRRSVTATRSTGWP
jgi:hypothetical protein